MKLIFSLLAVLSFVPAIGSGVWFPVEAQNWSRHQESNFRNVVAIIKPRRGGNCQNHRIRADGRVYDAQKGTRGSYLIVDQVVLLTGITATDPQGYKIWQVFYEPSRTKMWIKDCDLSIPRLVN